MFLSQGTPGGVPETLYMIWVRKHSLVYHPSLPWRQNVRPGPL